MSTDVYRVIYKTMKEIGECLSYFKNYWKYFYDFTV